MEGAIVQVSTGQGPSRQNTMSLAHTESLKRPCAVHDSWWHSQMEPEAWAPHWARHCGYTNWGQNLREGGGDEPSSALGSDEVAQLEKLFLA